MKTPSKKWSISIAVSLFAISVIARGTTVYAANGKTEGQNAGLTALSKFGSKNKVNANISQPMSDSSNQMTTVDGSKSFQATLNAPSSNKFLQVFIQPSGTGDLQQVMISEDRNSDGNIDAVYSMSRKVSGVCANGFISCTPGTWSNCSYYLWEDQASGIREKVATATDLGGCYCINISCGSNLVWQNSGIVLKDLAGGMVGALQRNNPALSISSVSNDPVTITYFGNVTNSQPTAAANVAAISNTATISTAESYYRNPPQLTAARDSIAINQSGATGTFYNMVSSSAAGTTGSLSNCIVQRQFTGAGGEILNNGCSAYDSNPDCKIKDNETDGVIVRQNFAATGLVQLPSCQTINGINTCREWWVQKKNYMCGNNSFTVSDVGTRFGTVTSNISLTGNTLNYKDTRKTRNTWTNTTGSIQIGDMTLGSDCELGCKTRAPKKDTQVTESGTTNGIPTVGTLADERVSVQSYDIFYRTCVNNSCPIEVPGEQIVTNCQCLNNFVDTAIFVQTLRQAGRDMICSSGTKKPM